jgi:beta-lactamase regulating signal transducer with metallopeptidase domain
MLLQIGVGNALAAAVLALVAAGVSRTCRRPALAHGLWLLVLLKLLTPPLLTPTIDWPSRPEPPAHESIPPAITAESLTVALPAEPLVPAPRTVEEGTNPAIGSEPLTPEPNDPVWAEDKASSVASTPTAPPPIPWQRVLSAAWLTGSALWFVLAGLAIYRFRRLLRLALPAPQRIQSQVDKLARCLGLAHAPNVALVPGKVSPMLWSLGGRPRLLLPSELFERLPPEQRATLLAHELAHLRRRDHWVRVLELVVTGLYWWHPVVWWARREIREAEEQCCDAWVLWALPAAARTYANALLETVDFLSRARPALPPAASGIGHIHLLRRRLTMIMRGTTPKALSGTGFCTVLVLGAVLLPLLPSWARTEPPLSAGADEPDKELLRARQREDAVVAREVVRQLRQEVEAQKAQVAAATAALKQAEANLQRALRQLKQSEERVAASERLLQDELLSRTKEDKGTGRKESVRPSAVPADRLAELEKKLDALREELAALRRQAAGPATRDARDPRLSPAVELNYRINLRLTRQFVLAGHDMGITSVACSPDGKTAVTGGADATLRLWDLATGREVRILRGHTGKILSVAFAPDGSHVLSGDLNGAVLLWDVASGKQVQRYSHPDKNSPEDLTTGDRRTGRISSVGFFPDGRRAFSADEDGLVRFWDLASGRSVRELFVSAPVQTAAVAADGKLLATGSSPGGLRLWDVASRRELWRVRAHQGSVWRVVFSPDGRRIASSGEDGDVRLWDVTTGKEVARLAGVQPNRVLGLAYSPDGRFLLAGGSDGNLRLWDATGETQWVVDGHGAPILSVAFAPDGRSAFAVYQMADGTARLWVLSR